jgi:uncharacterized membrane protein
MNHYGIVSENSNSHWLHMDTNARVLLDLGCGRNCTHDLYDSSPVYLGEKGALKVIGVDSNQDEINYFNSTNINTEKYVFITKNLTSTEDLLILINEYNPTAIKSDIEGWETIFYGLTKENMVNVEELAIEYHNMDIFDETLKKMEEWGFNPHTNGKFQYGDYGHMGVIFASRIKVF